MVEISEYQQDVLKISQSDLPWTEISGCNILVTGATGLIGGCFVEALMLNPKKDYNVYASGRNVERAKSRFKNYVSDKSFHFVRHDVLCPLECNIRFDFIIHAAWKL